MNAENCELAQAFVSKSYVEQGSQALAKRQKLIKALLSQRRLPPTGWDDATIQMFLQARTGSAHCMLHEAWEALFSIAYGHNTAVLHACDLRAVGVEVHVAEGVAQPPIYGYFCSGGCAHGLQ